MKLTQQQLEAASHRGGPALTLAVPGSGKTTLLLERLRLLARQGVEPGSILTLTFSRAAARDMKSRLGDDRFPVSTIHAFSLDLIRRTGTRIPPILSEREQRLMLDHIMKQTLSDEDFEALSGEIGLLYNRMLKRGDEDKFESAFPRIFEIAIAYHKRKREQDRIDYDDMLLLAKNRLERTPELRRALAQRYPYIQIDEAQDTSQLQFAVIEQLLGAQRNLFLVADDDQSIYGFRGAYPAYLLDFTRRYPDARLYRLDCNFRSDAHIVQTAATFIKDNVARYPKDIRPYHGHACPIAIASYPTILERNEALLEQLREITRHADRVGILFRNRLSALSVIDCLDRDGIEFATREGIEREFRHWIVRDLKAFMELAMIPNSLEAFTQIWYKMNAFISKEMFEDACRRPGSAALLQKVATLPYLKNYQVDTIDRFIEAFAELRRLRPYDAIHFIESQLGYLAFLNNRYEKQMHSLRERLDAVKAVAKYCMDSVELFERLDALAERANNVQATVLHGSSPTLTLTTVHGSKGLEYDHVYLIDVNPGSFPSERSDLEEERRLFYVAMTRAKKRLCLLHADFVNGAHNPKSVFVERLIEQSPGSLTPRLDGVAVRKSPISEET